MLRDEGGERERSRRVSRRLAELLLIPEKSAPIEDSIDAREEHLERERRSFVFETGNAANFSQVANVKKKGERDSPLLNAFQARKELPEKKLRLVQKKKKHRRKIGMRGKRRRGVMMLGKPLKKTALIEAGKKKRTRAYLRAPSIESAAYEQKKRAIPGRKKSHKFPALFARPRPPEVERRNRGFASSSCLSEVCLMGTLLGSGYSNNSECGW